MKTMLLRTLSAVVVLLPAVTFTQTKPAAATYITKEEVDTVNKEGQGTDRTIRVADIGTENFAVGIIHRGAPPGVPAERPPVARRPAVQRRRRAPREARRAEPARRGRWGRAASRWRRCRPTARRA